MTKEERKEYDHNNYMKNREKCIKRAREYKENTDYNKNQRYKYMISRYEIIALLGGECIICGETDIRCLQIDHINGGGTKERRGNSGGYYKNILEKIKGGSKEYQILCANHNWIKRFENNEIF